MSTISVYFNKEETAFVKGKGPGWLKRLVLSEMEGPTIILRDAGNVSTDMTATTVMGFLAETSGLPRCRKCDAALIYPGVPICKRCGAPQ